MSACVWVFFDKQNRAEMAVAWSNGIILQQNFLWACLVVCVEYVLMFLGVCGCVWVFYVMQK